eukprot:Phypoly_transcript_09652.p1 GENE.Phypoly_transcript_09652~~Phypoly_transcript_09652.p1  ORF type:complete len:444 (+),score=46.37 Phypoly_transcript_09652:82-1332(+)
MKAGTTQINRNGAKLILSTDGCPDGCDGRKYKASGMESKNSYGLGWFNLTAQTSSSDQALFFFYWYDSSDGKRDGYQVSVSKSSIGFDSILEDVWTEVGNSDLSFDGSTGFHTYSLLRSSQNSASLYVDGVLVLTTNLPHNHNTGEFYIWIMANDDSVPDNSFVQLKSVSYSARFPSDGFSVAWTGQLEAMYSGVHTFYTQADDGVKLYIDDNLLIDDYVDQALTESSATMTMVAGHKYDIKVLYYEDTGDSEVHLLWSQGSCLPKQVIPQSQLYAIGDGLEGNYFSGVNFDSYVASRLDTTINFDWSTGSPFAGIPVDGFSIMWTGLLLAPCSGTYTFYLTSDDGVILTINGQTVISNWVGGTTNLSGTLSLTGNQLYNLSLNYYEGTGYAYVKLSWASSCASQAIIPQSQLFSQ